MDEAVLDECVGVLYVLVLRPSTSETGAALSPRSLYCLRGSTEALTFSTVGGDRRGLGTSNWELKWNQVCGFCPNFEGLGSLIFLGSSD